MAGVQTGVHTGVHTKVHTEAIKVYEPRTTNHGPRTTDHGPRYKVATFRRLLRKHY